MIIKPGKLYTLGYFPHMWIYYVKGVSDTEACIMWELACWAGGNDLNYGNAQHPRSIINYTKGKNVPPTAIHPTLKIKKGEVKIIVECAICYANDCFFDDHRSCSDVPARTALGFLVLSPKYKGIIVDGSFFNAIAVFTPKAGLFDEILPE